MEVFVGRQPIFNRHEEIAAYELLYRNNYTNQFPNIDADTATVELLINFFFRLALKK